MLYRETNRVATVLSIIVQGQAYPMLSSAERKYTVDLTNFIKDFGRTCHHLFTVCWEKYIQTT